MKLDFEFATSVSQVARRAVSAGLPIEQCWPKVVAKAAPKLGKSITRAALKVPVSQSLTTVTAHYAQVLTRRKPAAWVADLYFGIQTIQTGLRDSDVECCTEIYGFAEYKPGRRSKAWRPDDGQVMCDAMAELSALRGRSEDTEWLVEMTLIESLNLLFAACFCRDAPRDLLLGDRDTRSVCSGFGDSMGPLGTIDYDGFKVVPPYVYKPPH